MTEPETYVTKLNLVVEDWFIYGQQLFSRPVYSDIDGAWYGIIGSNQSEE